MTMSSITPILQATLSPDDHQKAEEHLNTLAAQNFPQYLSLLCAELLNESISAEIRFMAALLIKNAITAKELPKKQEYAQRWLGLDLQTRTGVKGAALMALSSTVRNAASGATQIVQAVAEVELPLNQWPELIPTMLENVTNQTDNVDLRRNTLQALGLVCEAVDPEVLVQYSNPILTAVVSGARKEEPSAQVQETALKALYNALEFVKSNFNEPGERNYIMTVVCEATRGATLEVQVAAFECLVKIMSLYYEHMEPYMNKALKQLTLWGLKQEKEEIAIQAVEFWSTVCEIEAEIMAENDMDEDEEELEDGPRKNYEFGFANVTELIEALWWLMTKKEEDDDEDEWTISMAASTCLALLASCAHDHVVQPVLTFVETHIHSSDWRYKDASVMAFGSILDGPNPDVLGPVTAQALPILISLMKDPSLQVKDTTAWTLGRVCEMLPTYIPPDCLPLFISAILEGLNENPRVAANCSWAIMNIGENLGVAQGAADTYVLSPFFDAMVQATNAAADRSTDPNFKATCYEAMSSLVANSAQDCLDTVTKLAVMVLERLEHSVAVQNQLVSADDKRNHYEHQSNLCGLLASCIRRMHGLVFPIADRSMQALLMVMSSASRQSTVMEDAFLTVGGLTNALEGDFFRYMDAFAPPLFAALQNVEEYQMCAIAVGLVGDITRSLGEKMLPYCDTLMNILMTDLQNPALNKTVKPSILSSFGDIALAIGGHFATYMDVTVQVLQQASAMASTVMTGYDSEYGNQLREGIIEAYVGIAQGLKGANKVEMLATVAPQIFAFVQEVATSNSPRSLEVSMGLVGLIGDMAEAFPPGRFKPLFSAPWINNFIKSIRTDRNFDSEHRKVAKWARELVRRQASAA
ncbi:hypothetical protein PhCBS80983_g00772 [Powellomyces hirtus]|uniref:Importin-95 n=1 Tax=Powellomyces hirtus TaxID=109895 RepID=A0A507EDM9_9FUNG|nr:armadillo-type protein [Powellomyces hirtus]TPX61941.1 hypothetical protein PhCBS80983_g00772 [Powellomyces hirtus]